MQFVLFYIILLENVVSFQRLIIWSYRVFRGNWDKVWAYCIDFSGILKLRTCGKCLLIQGHFEICFLNWVKISFTFWLSPSEKLLKFLLFVNIQSKYQEQNEQNVVSVTEDRVTGFRVTGVGVIGVRVTGVRVIVFWITEGRVTGIRVTGIGVTGVRVTGVRVIGVRVIGV